MPIHKLEESLKLEEGGQLESVEIEYSISGIPKKNGSNVIVVCHTLTGSLDVVDSPLWSFIGKGATIDPDENCIICLGTLGGLNESTGPRTKNKEGKEYGPEFPTVTVKDSVVAHSMVLSSLGIQKAMIVIGGSYGGFCAYTWLALKPHFFDLAIIFQSSLWCSAHTIAFFSLCRELIISSPSWQKGRYDRMDMVNTSGYKHMIAVNKLIQMSHTKFEEKFPKKQNNKLQEHRPSYWQKHSIIDEFMSESPKNIVDPNTLLSTMRSSSLFNLEKSFPGLWDNWGEMKTIIVQIPCIQDWRYPAEGMLAIHEKLKKIGIRSIYRTTNSNFGHGSFLYDPRSIKEVCLMLDDLLKEMKKGDANQTMI